MRPVKDMVVLKLDETDTVQNGVLILSQLDKVRSNASVVYAGDKSKLKEGDKVVFNPDMRDAYDAETKHYFIRDFKISAVIK